MKLPETVRCCICGKDITPSQPCDASRLKGAGTVYAHTECIKQRKESAK